ncbi:lipopolysaccharide transport periplasmic protein LptA [Methylococcus sp. EFPC2]|uniref:lipopolysaccharide transport periplasmic protein LptA n=1 Tax=Methylococcus sp. EFPC2 TaxID=2812648 RepID=UPI0019680921|nr:lipopolysaccharide transport periplasmic protein LptA [Methylococcus sp. EFPC2]QSA97955.1 lipopolysaccharide transport periplasmic protein LptA [Methylococcus sp. EFPC2]
MKCVKFALPLLGLLSPLAWGLESDAKQPIYIEADSATYDEAKGETVYVGNVHTTQGSLEVFGDRMIVLQKNGKTEKILSYGNPTRLKQTPEPNKPDWHGTGQRAEYFPETGILVLYENALAWQGNQADSSDRVASDRIEYDSRRSVMKAGVPAGSPGGKRVRVTLQPQDGKAAE